jgi:hypothetical protein
MLRDAFQIQVAEPSSAQGTGTRPRLPGQGHTSE